MSMQKKMERAYEMGFHQACDFWEEALRRTPGVGPKTIAKIMIQVAHLAMKMQHKRDEPLKPN